MAAVSSTGSTLALPVFYQPLVDQHVVANISWGTPAQNAIPTVISTASYGFWVNGPGAIVNSGSPYLGKMGPCNQTVEPVFDWTASTSHTGPYDEGTSFGYGGPSIDNIQVAICNLTHIRARGTTCEGLHYDKSMMGLAPILSIAGGPEIHPQILRQGRVSSSVFSMWFDAPPQDINEPQIGTLLFGAIPTDKYAGALVTVRNEGQDRDEKGFYYVGLPEVRAAHINGPANQKTSIPVRDAENAPDCLFDSGTWGLTLPTPDDDFFTATGLVKEPPFINPSYPAACADIPLDVGFELVFKGQDGNSEATVKIPYRSLAGGQGNEPNTCSLNLQLGDPGCIFGGPFYASAFIAHDDDAKTLQIAQGAVAVSAQNPPAQARR